MFILRVQLNWPRNDWHGEHVTGNVLVMLVYVVGGVWYEREEDIIGYWGDGDFNYSFDRYADEHIQGRTADI